MAKKVLISDGVHELLIKGFENRGFHVDYQPDISLSEVHEIISDYEGLIINSKIKVDNTLIDKAEKLRFVGRLGSGLEIIDLTYASSKGIHCFNTPEGNRNAVAEHCLGMLLSLFNNIVKSNMEFRKGQWIREENRGEELDGKTVGIIGYGNTGQAFAKKLRGFDVKVLAFDKYKKGFEDDFVRESTLKQIFEEVDVLSLHLPLTSETHHWLNEESIHNFKRPFYIINSSRGKCIHQENLLKNIQRGKVLGAVLDVLENEQLDELKMDEKNVIESLNSLNNVIITPHIAGWTHQSKLKIAMKILDKFDRL